MSKLPALPDRAVCHQYEIRENHRGKAGNQPPFLMPDLKKAVIRKVDFQTAKPIIVGVGPASAKATELVTITGHFFNDATSVKFGATNATNFAVVADNRIIATVPAGSAGSVNITITNPIGVSDNFAYTRGA